MRVCLIAPRLPIQKGDVLGSGVPYWPVELAVFAGHLRQGRHAVALIDLFGTEPSRLEPEADHYLQGRPIDEYFDDPGLRDADVVVVYATSYMAHAEVLRIIAAIRARFSHLPIGVLENAQAVTGYSIDRLRSAFFEAGATGLICGEPFANSDAILHTLRFDAGAEAPNVVTRFTPETQNPRRLHSRHFEHALPAWELFPLGEYWKLPYSHGPKTPTFLPLVTSRGCPYPCDFCVIPETSDRVWSPRTPEEVVREVLTFRDVLGVRDFQVEDLNPTVHAQRWRSICRGLIEARAGVRLYLVSGTKAETVHVEDVPLLARAGVRYLSISPESGSAELMRTIGKRFNYDHGVRLVEACRAEGIRTQACFLVGHPAETSADHERSRDYLRRLVRAGVDEVAVFIVASFAGSQLYRQRAIAVDRPQALPSFSPRGRSDYRTLAARRRELLACFFAERLRYRSGAMVMQTLRAIRGRPETKMENVPRRLAFMVTMLIRMHLRRRVSPRAAWRAS